jgi:hypothetical protein
MDKFILNIIHRPEMVPEYAEKITGQGKKEDITRKDLLTESLDIFKLQQQVAHDNGFKTTIQMTYASLFNEEAIAIAKEHHKAYGDEISLTLLGLPCKEFREKYKTKDFCLWMFSLEDKMSIVDDLFAKFHEIFGFYPQSTGCYFMDADLINYIKGKYPSVKCAVATCWEEGPKAYRTCNSSWYTLFDGGPWNPWIPSKKNSHVPAKDLEDDSGIVAIPHLSRDLLACFDGNGSNFGTHPQNVLRGMIYKDREFPYLFNLIDQYKALKKYNKGFSYNMVFVGPAWLNKAGRWEAPFELLVKSYKDCFAYYGELRDKGEIEDMTMSEFADWYRENKTYTEPTCALWKDILYGSDKQLFWYVDPYMRTCLDMNQGGAMVDLRPYAARLEWPVGIGTKHVQDASYPYLVQAMYRAGYFTHYAGEGTIKSCKLSYKGEEVDLCLCRTKAQYSETDNARVITLDPVEIEFYDLSLKLVSEFTFVENTGEILTSRKIYDLSDPGAKVHLDEYITACYGTTEYPEDMTGITLQCAGENDAHEISYDYKCREASVSGAVSVGAIVPQVETKLSVRPVDCAADGYFREGYAFSPMFTLGITKDLSNNEELSTCLKLERAD